MCVDIRNIEQSRNNISQTSSSVGRRGSITGRRRLRVAAGCLTGGGSRRSSRGAGRSRGARRSRSARERNRERNREAAKDWHFLDLGGGCRRDGFV